MNLKGVHVANESQQEELATGSPVSMLSLTRHSPASRTASQGSSRPSWGRTRQSPGTRSMEVTHSSSGKSKKETPRNKCLRGNYGLGTRFRRRPSEASRDPRIKSKIPHSRLFSRGVKWSLKLMKPLQSCLREEWKLHWCETLSSFDMPTSFIPHSAFYMQLRHQGDFFMQEKLSHSWKPSILWLIFPLLLF